MTQIHPDATFFRLPSKKLGKRLRAPQYGIIHATRGAAGGSQYGGTINWFTSPANGGADWGPCSDALVGADGKVAVFTEPDTQHPRWSAGRGAAGTFPADEYGFSIEVAQSAALEDYTDAQVARLGEILAECNWRWGIPLVRIPFLAQDPAKPIPGGWVGHEDTANGKFTGKSDPGPKFPWARVFAAAEALLRPATLTAEQRTLLEWLEAHDVGAANRQQMLRDAGLPPTATLADYDTSAPAPGPTPTPTQPAPPPAEPAIDRTAVRRHLDTIDAEIAAVRRLVGPA